MEALQKSHIENIAAFLGKSYSQTTKVLQQQWWQCSHRPLLICALFQGTPQKGDMDLLASPPLLRQGLK